MIYVLMLLSSVWSNVYNFSLVRRTNASCHCLTSYLYLVYSIVGGRENLVKIQPFRIVTKYWPEIYGISRLVRLICSMKNVPKIHPASENWNCDRVCHYIREATLLITGCYLTLVASYEGRNTAYFSVIL
jgi:hypothetical protein